jgi:5-epi-alpha-selinene synthase
MHGGCRIHNLVLVLMNERGISLTEAVAQAVELHDNEVRSFLQCVEQLPSFGAADADVECYVEMLRCWIRGHLDWAHETGRYRPFEERTGEQAAEQADTQAAEQADTQAAEQVAA